MTTQDKSFNSQQPTLIHTSLLLELPSFGIARIFLDSLIVICFFIFQGRTKNAQFVINSLRNNTFELADRLLGIFKTDNCTN